jgi:hypothetical protein
MKVKTKEMGNARQKAIKCVINENHRDFFDCWVLGVSPYLVVAVGEL